MPDEHYENEHLAAFYDLENGWAADSDFFLSLAGNQPIHILDIGCGTGLLSDAYAALGHHVTGIEPALGMLGLAKQRPHAVRIQWRSNTARNFTTEQMADLAIMSGNVFQIFSSSDERLAVLKNCHQHLKTGGCLVFDTRNPAFDWCSLWEGKTVISCDPQIGYTRHIIEHRAEKIRFITRYYHGTKEWESESSLYFVTLSEINKLLESAGFTLVSAYGGWDSRPYDESTSPTLIIKARAD